MMKKKHRKPADILRTIASPLASKHLYYTIEMAFEGETGASEGCSSLETPAPSNRYWANTYFFSGGFAVKCSL